MAHMKVMEFQGDPKANTPPTPPMSLPPVTNLDLTPGPDVPLAILKRKMMATNDLKVSRELLEEINRHLKVGSKRMFYNCGQQLHDSGSQPVGLFVLRSGRYWPTTCTEWSRRWPVTRWRRYKFWMNKPTWPNTSVTRLQSTITSTTASTGTNRR